MKPGLTRRRFILGTLAAGAAMGGYTWRAEPTWLELVRREMPVPGLPKGWAGRVLVQISDVHAGPQVDDEFLRRAFAQVQALQPDVVAYTGDFITYAGRATLEQFRRLAPALPRGTAATVAALGNHDYGEGCRQSEVAVEVAGILAAEGIAVLRNESVDCAGLRLAGLDDLWANRLELDVVRAPAAPYIVLCHNPDACDLAGWGDFSGWVLAGHTHGGQCKPPFLPPPLLPVKNRRYTAGEFVLSGGRRLYINRGLGHLLRVRFNVRPEITVFRLVG
ncbi:MAG TPA: metallophosphoesterase [Opitutaceae bacterium]|nr:metallophosphoesterase [Opitutaceae bacterium]